MRLALADASEVIFGYFLERFPAHEGVLIAKSKPDGGLYRA
jgi:hypothetical protein